jgi:hypothetical protein
MTATLWLRIASGLTFLHAVLHTIGGVFGKPASAAQQAVAEAMKATFPVLGITRSYADFYLGMGLGITIALLVDATAFWILGSMAKSEPARLRPVIAAFLVGYVAFAVNSWKFFFAGPVIGEILIAGCLALALLKAKPAGA